MNSHMASVAKETGKSKEITLVLADDHSLVRQGLRALLESEHGFRVIGEAATGIETIRMVERLRPQVLVLDLMIPELNGLDVIRQLTKRTPETRVVVLSMHKDESYVIQALKNGATGYVLKDSSAHELVKAVHEALANRRYLSPPLAQAAIESYFERALPKLSIPTVR